MMISQQYFLSIEYLLATAIFTSTTTTAPTSVTSMGAATTAAKTNIMYTTNQQPNQQMPSAVPAGKLQSKTKAIY